MNLQTVEPVDSPPSRNSSLSPSSAESPALPDSNGWTEMVAALAGERLNDGRREEGTGETGETGDTSWAAAGMGRLTLDASGAQLDASGPFAQRLSAVATRLPFPVDPLPLLTERALIAGLRGRKGSSSTLASQSVGGTAWIVAARDGWFCLNLARQEDAAALPALLEADVDHRDWDRLLAVFAERPVDELDHRSMLLGMPASRVPPEPLGTHDVDDPQIRHRHGQRLSSPFLVTDHGAASMPDMRNRAGRPLVVDMTSLWAGPLCGSLLAAAGCRVIKVEGRRRPDGARSGPPPFFDLMNAGKECIALDFADRHDRLILDRLLAKADVVLEGSRPRVMDALGIDPHHHVERRQGCWVSVTAFGRTGPWSNRVGFGDDVAASAGVVARKRSGELENCPTFVGDALADPVGGLVAASAAWHAISTNRSVVIDVALREAVGFVWGATTLDPAVPAAFNPPQARRAAQSSRAFDADGAQIRKEVDA